MTELSNAKIVIFATDGFEQSELEVPLKKLRDHGATVHVASPDGRDPKGWEGKDWGRAVTADMKIGEVEIADYDCLVLPGGQINPDLLRADEDVVAKVRDFVSAGKIVAAICHGPWLLVEAGVVEGREMTSYHSIRTDLKNAGAVWVDRDVVVSDGIITSRKPDDLEAFVAKIVEEIREGAHSRAAA